MDYDKFDKLVKVARQNFKRKDPVSIVNAFRIRSFLYEVLKPWGASNIAVTMRHFETGVDRVGMSKGYLIEAWVQAIFGYKGNSLKGEMQNVDLRTFIARLNKRYPKPNHVEKDC